VQRRKFISFFLLIAPFVISCTPANDPVANSAAVALDKHADLRASMRAVEPFFQRMGKPGKYDWLATFKEPGQTFDEYISSNPTLPTAERNVIYIQPLGKFNSERSSVIEAAAEYLEAFYGLTVKTLPVKPLPNKLPEPDQRMIDYPAHRQLRTGWVMDNVLKPALPGDAAALIAFTNDDLYPDSSMYFVFGQASLEDRVGVWSLYRLDDEADFNRFQERTMKIAAHEVGHMFSFRHCTKYECVMSGTNHLAETDRRPIDACPECMAKIAWMTRKSPADRYERLIGFAKRNKLSEAKSDFEKKLKAVQ
jgi:archaemetzincin